jgi:hypothetical protein
MVKSLVPALLFIIVMTGCSSLKPFSSGNNQVVATQVASPAKSSNADGNLKFLDDISVTAKPTVEKSLQEEKNSLATSGEASESGAGNSNIISSRTGTVEKASSLHLKYAVLLNTEVEFLEDCTLLPYVDEWYGTRYRMGGTNKTGIDCSAFTQAIYLSAFALNLPRTARDQYKSSRIISATQLKEGDLVFFNTTGGVSHVGIYLQNNKFVHASSRNGVVISDLFEPYYLKRYLGAGRIEKPEARK